jgi:adenylosuccinate lyase
MHQGMTSPTCSTPAFGPAGPRQRPPDRRCRRLLAALKRRAFEHKYTPTIGRSHGIHAEPTTFGLKLAQAYAEFDRCRARLVTRARKSPPAPSRARSAPSPTSTPRSRNMSPKAGPGGRAGLDPGHPARPPRRCSSRRWASSPVRSSGWPSKSAICSAPRCWRPRNIFSPGQKGSSAMPHKRNPVLTENLTGLARLVRSAVVPALENVALWHERDISHSSVERFIGPDATITLDFALAPAGRRHRQAAGLSREHAEATSTRPRRPGSFAARAAGADPGRASPRGRVFLVGAAWSSATRCGGSGTIRRQRRPQPYPRKTTA